MTTIEEKFLKKMINNRKFLNRGAKKRAKKNGEQIRYILKVISKYDYELYSDEDLPRLEFIGAIERYLLGFNEDSVRTSIIAVEMGLIIRLNEILSDNEKEQICIEMNRERNPLSFTFGYLVNLCMNNKYKILRGKRIKNIAENLIKYRNIHFHTPTFLAGIIVQEKNYLVPLMDNYLNDINIIRTNRILKYYPPFIKLDKIISEKKRYYRKSFELYMVCTRKQFERNKR